MMPNKYYIPEELIPYTFCFPANQPVDYLYPNIDTSDKKRLQQFITQRENLFKFISELEDFARSLFKEEYYILE